MKLFTRILATLACVGIIGCGGVKIKQNAVLSAQGIESTLRTARETELTLYQSGTVAQLTPAIHQQINATLVEAFDDQIKLASVLKEWRSGDPVPTTLNAIIADMQDTIRVITMQLPSSQVTNLLEKVSAVILAVQQTELVLGGK